MDFQSSAGSSGPAALACGVWEKELWMQIQEREFWASLAANISPGDSQVTGFKQLRSGRLRWAHHSQHHPVQKSRQFKQR